MTRWKSVLACLIILTILFTPMQAFAESNGNDSMPVNELYVSNPNYFGCFTIAKEKTKKISIHVSTGITADKDLLWKTSDESVVSVTDQGVITGLKKGKADIVVSTVDGSGLQLSIPVIVGIPVKSITGDVKKLSLTEGDYYETKVTVLPKNATDQQSVFRSSNETIATVSDTGVIKAIAPGKATIFMVAKDGSGKKGSIYVTVNGISNNKILTNRDVSNGRIELSNAYYKNITIDGSVGNASIILDHITVRGKLMMPNNAGYTVYAKNCDIKHMEVGATETEPGRNKVSPAFETSDGTSVTTMTIQGNLSIRQMNQTKIESISVSSEMDEVLELMLEGFQGNLLVNSGQNADIKIMTNECNIQSVTYSGNPLKHTLTLTDISTGGKQSTIDNVMVESAKLDLDVRSKELNISARSASSLLFVRKPVDIITNDGIETDISVFGKVQSFNSTGALAFIKLESGTECTELNTSGEKTSLYLADNAFIESVTTKGKGTKIIGTGSIKKIKVEGNDTSIGDMGSIVIVGKNVSGTIFILVPLGGGAQVQSDKKGGIKPIFLP